MIIETQPIGFRLYFDLSGKRRTGKLVTDNHHTIWAKVMTGAKSYIIIKRHKVKHNVRFKAVSHA